MGEAKDKNQIIVPFLKWAGGKRWLVSNHPDIFPSDFNNYLEPFLGSGAVYFHLKPQRGILSGINTDLVFTYRAIKSDWKRVQKSLNSHHRKHSREYYYKLRESEPSNMWASAARLIYLNRTCWNALYRVNKRGEFNVPIGTKANVLLPSDDFEVIASLLRKSEINQCDFEETIDRAKRNDFLFVDPPYTVKHNYNGFIKYNKTLFSWDDQVRLFEALRRAKRRGVKIIATNADHESIRKLYGDEFKQSRASRTSVLAAAPKYRGSVTELIIST